MWPYPSRVSSTDALRWNPTEVIRDTRTWRVIAGTDFVVFVSILLVFIGNSLATQAGRISTLGYGVVVADRSRLGTSSGYALAPGAWSTLLACVCAVEATKRRINSRSGWGAWALGALIAVMSISSGLLMGSRSQTLVVFSLGTVMILQTAGRGKISRRGLITVTTVVLCVVAVGVVLSNVREDLMGSPTLRGPTEVNITPADSIEGLIGAFGTSENVVWLIQNSDRWNPRWGATFWTAFVGWVPRSLWPEKPVGGGPVLRNWIFPGTYDITSFENNTSYTTGLPAEGFMNFGWSAIILVAVPYGFTLGWVQNLGKRVDDSVKFAAWSYSSYTLGMSLLVGEFYGVASWLAIGLAPLMVIGLSRRMTSGNWRMLYRRYLSFGRVAPNMRPRRMWRRG